jgi:hypothetical protein
MMLLLTDKFIKVSTDLVIGHKYVRKSKAANDF